MFLESANDSLQLPASTSVLSVPRTPGDTPQGRVRKCSIVQEEEDEEEYCGVVGSGQELTPPHSSLNRRGSRSEGKLNIAIQVRVLGLLKTNICVHGESFNVKLLETEFYSSDFKFKFFSN